LSNVDPQVRKKQVLTIMELYGRLSKQTFPILVIGTFNSLMPAVAPSSSARTGAMGLLLERTNLLPALSSEAAQLSGQPVGTFPADRPIQKIDYILHNPNYVVPTSAEVLCGDGPHHPSSHCAVTMSFLLPRPKDKLPEKRIPDDRLPSLDRLLGDSETK
jgi:endonuclease/exonuclease/phosphatase family metal-dependent hydrolase